MSVERTVPVEPSIREQLASVATCGSGRAPKWADPRIRTDGRYGKRSADWLMFLINISKANVTLPDVFRRFFDPKRKM